MTNVAAGLFVSLGRVQRTHSANVQAAGRKRYETMEIMKADSSHLQDLARLFDLYRQFYECPPDAELASRFLRERMDNGESDIFLARVDQTVCGFVQLYPTFCSVDAVKIYILHDLFVDAAFRKSGVGEKLMNRATQWARENGAGRLDLLTGTTNLAGQHI